MESRYASLRFVSYGRSVVGMVGGRRNLSAAIGAKLALGGCVGMRMDVWARCDE